MIIQATDGDRLVLTKTTLSEQGRNSNVPSRIRSYVHLVDLIPALNVGSRIALYPLSGGWRDPHRSWMFTTADLSIRRRRHRHYILIPMSEDDIGVYFVFNTSR